MKLKVCFFAFNAYPALTGKSFGFVGGAELRQALIGKELAKRGYGVSFVVHDHGQKSPEIIQGVKVFKTLSKEYKLSGLKSYCLSIITVWEVMKKADADVYFQCTAGRDMGFTALFCLLNRKKFIYGLVSDMDVDGTFEKNASLLSKLFHRFGLWKANRITAQNEGQKDLLKKNYRKESIVIKNPYPIPTLNLAKEDPPVILWVGTIHPRWKRPELFLELAKRIPDAHFQMIGGPSDGEGAFYEKIKDEAQKISNLEFLGFVPYPKVNDFFDKASVFVNTSTVEGFPNTFLQAWSGYTSIVSLDIDPDEVLCKKNVGMHSKTFNQMVEDVRFLLKNEGARNSIGLSGRRHVVAEHDIQRIVDKYIQLIDDLK